jgi:galactose mutarotase-like enzyme
MTSVPTITTRQDTFTIYRLSEASTSSWVEVCPERGGIITAYGVQGKELLYLDKSTLDDPKANIRGGIPVLFPICGQLPGGEYEWNGQTYSMKNHGVVRQLPWEVVETGEDRHASITLRIASNEETLAAYPFEFELLFTYSLSEGKLRIQQEYRNLSAELMPFFAGFHPYFQAERKEIAYKSDAESTLDYNDMQEAVFTGRVDLTDLIESVVLLGAKTPEIAFSPASDTRIVMTYGEVFKYVVLWSVIGKPFVCVEPWMALNGEFERRQELQLLKPGGVLITDLTIAIELN